MLTDNDLMPYGEHIGVAMVNIPAKELLAMYESEECTDEVKAYIEDNIEILKKEAKNIYNQ